jgi:hypothetical protein
VACPGCGQRNGLQVRRVAVNMSNILSKKTSSGPPAWGVGEVLTTPHHKILRCYETFYKALDLE